VEEGRLRMGGWEIEGVDDGGRERGGGRGEGGCG